MLARRFLMTAGPRGAPTHRTRDGAVTLLLGLAAAFVHHTSLTLASPGRPAGLLELAAIGLALARPDAPLGLALLHIDVVLFGMGVAIFVHVAHRTTRSWTAAAAAGVALGCLPLFDQGLAPLASGVILAVSLVMAAYQAAVERRTARFSGAFILSLACAALTLPGLTLLLVLAAVLLVFFVIGVGTQPGFSRRWWLLAAGPVLIAGLTVGVFRLLPAPDVDSPPGPFSIVRQADAVAAAAGAVRSVVLSAGPYALALAFYGLFSHWRRLRSREGAGALGLSLVPMLSLLLTPANQARVAVAAALPFWLLVSAGLAAVIEACGARLSGRLAAGVFVTLVPLLTWSARAESMPPGVAAIGHERWSLHDIDRVRVSLPPDAVVIADDALSDVLLRAAAAHPAGAITPTVSRTTSEIDRQLDKNRPIFALPAAQQQLQNLGYRIDPGQGPAGVAQVKTGPGCRVATTAWRDVSWDGAAQAIALAARDETERGPILVYAWFDGARPEVRPRDWPPGALYGYHSAVYVLSGDGQEAFKRDAAADGLPEDRRAADGAAVRLELWRVPRAPRELAVELGAAPARVTMRLIPDDNRTRLLVCAAFPVPVTPLQP
jgi:hypothetical protein